MNTDKHGYEEGARTLAALKAHLASGLPTCSSQLSVFALKQLESRAPRCRLSFIRFHPCSSVVSNPEVLR
jgi:hypothetical protein